MSDLRELADELDLEFWLQREGVEYKLGRGRSGMQANIMVCPCCGDRRWRTYLNVDTGLGNCFVCGEAFNKLKFVHEQLGVSWPETIKQVREVLKEQGWRPKRQIVVAVDETTVKMPLSMELPSKEGQNLVYLESRGVTGDWAKFFKLRYCIDGWWNFTKDDGSTGGQQFSNRLLIPVFDLDGEFKTFQGRDLTGTSDRKYLFPKGLPGTGLFLLNGQNAMRRKRVVMGEGFFDVAAIKIAFADDKNLMNVEPVGSFGKHLSYGSLDGNDQLGRFVQLKRSGLQEVTIMWDGEPAALTAALDAARLLKKIGLVVRIALLPKGCDPNEVTPDVVRASYYAAKLFDHALDVKLRLKNPYS